MQPSRSLTLTGGVYLFGPSPTLDGVSATWLDGLVAGIQPVSARRREAAERCHDQSTKLPGSLGCLKELSCRLAAIQERLPSRVTRPCILVFAGDHGVAAAEGVSPYACEVTGQMVTNFVGGAVINAVVRDRRQGLPAENVFRLAQDCAGFSCIDCHGDTPSIRVVNWATT